MAAHTASTAPDAAHHLMCSKAWSVQCCVTVHCKEPLKSFEIRVGHSPGFGLPSVAILP